MTKQRTITAMVLAPIAICAVLFLPTLALAMFGGGVFLAALWEWTRLVGFANDRVRGTIVTVSALLMLALWLARGAGNIGWWGAIGAGLIWWIMAAFWLRHYAFAAAPTKENTALKLAAGTLVVLPAWTALIQVHADGRLGPEWALLGVTLVWAADTGAYLIGRRFGAAKLAPRISPGKTWAGVYGALIAAAMLAPVGGWLLGARGLALAGLVVLALVTVTMSIVGDLFESLIKRHANVKDSGTLFPGHGGLFDRLDSVFAALPVWAAGRALLGL